jgi:hypothetical protein
MAIVGRRDLVRRNENSISIRNGTSATHHVVLKNLRWCFTIVDYLDPRIGYNEAECMEHVAAKRLIISRET